MNLEKLRSAARKYAERKPPASEAFVAEMDERRDRVATYQ
jgi:hypothetical protein